MPSEPVFLSVAEAYDRWASSYDGYDNPMVFVAAHALQRLSGVAGADVVELGCGTGRNLAALKARGARSLTGLDLSAGMLAKARARDASFRLLRHDIAAPVPLAASVADLVLFCLALEHVRELGPPLAEARRLLRPGGRAVAIEIHPFLALGGVAAHFKEGGQEVRMPTYPHRFADYLNAFAAAGLRPAECREWRPRDLPEAPAKALKRGADVPLAVEFVAVPA